ncbi:MAG TPA: hypothetical protein VD905_03230 [Flavobacteriales bacterium]|nr:hypothetical protein [Flavobacteriales bacterium]
MSNFNNKDQAITPKMAFICSMLYVVAADGEVDAQEIGNLLRVVGASNVDGNLVVGGENPELFKTCFTFVKKHSSDEFIDLVTTQNILSHKQKMFILANMLDSILSDRELKQHERQLVTVFQEKFGISNQEFKPVYEVILFKNNKTLF